METQDRQAIDDLFTRLGEVERRSPPRDPEAEALIRRRVAEQPAAPYLMAQTIVVQEQALEMARLRIAELERRAERPAGGGFLSGLFGGGQPAGRARTPGVSPMPQNVGRGMAGPGRGGGFLAGAAQTAVGVAGGVVLGNMIAGMLAGDPAAAAEAPQDEPQAEPASDEEGGMFDSFLGGDEEI